MGWRMSQQSSNEMDPVPEEYLILFETIWFQIQPKCQKKKKKKSTHKQKAFIRKDETLK